MSGAWQDITISGAVSPGQTGTAMMARGAAIAANSRTAMIRNHWGGKVARCAFMAGKCVLILNLAK